MRWFESVPEKAESPPSSCSVDLVVNKVGRAGMRRAYIHFTSIGRRNHEQKLREASLEPASSFAPVGGASCCERDGGPLIAVLRPGQTKAGSSRYCHWR